MNQTLYGTLDQWRALVAVVDHGGYARAAEFLNRSQSTVNYSVTRLEQLLGVKLLEVQGRKAKLTFTGAALLKRARRLINDAADMEQLARSIREGREAEIQLVVDEAFPTHALMLALKKFEPVSEGTRVQLKEVVLSGAVEALESGNADLVITGIVPPDFVGRHISEIEFVPVAHPDHPLHQMGENISMDDLRRHLQVVVSDSGIKKSVDVGWLGAEHRWTVTSLETALTALSTGLGFAWLPCHQIQEKINQNKLKILPLAESGKYRADLYLVFGKPSNTGPASRQLADILCSQCNSINSRSN